MAFQPVKAPGGDLDLDDLHEADLAKRLAFLGLSDAVAERLRALAPALRGCGDQFVEAFYEHLASFEETAKFLRDASLVERLKRLQLEHFESMLEARWDKSFVERLNRVGRVHADRGLQPQFMLAAYFQYVEQCLDHFARDEFAGDHFAGDDDPRGGQSQASVRSFLKAVFLDLGLTMEAYFARSTQHLRQALDMYWKTNSELRGFAELASHDLKTPLATVANLCDEALVEFGDQMPEEACDLIEKARQRSFRMSTMIDELLTATTSDETTYKETEVSCGQAVREAIERVRPVIQSKGIELVVAQRMPTVKGDKVRLREVFYNLLSHAAKFVDGRSGRIEIATDLSDGPCIVSVQDNGPGIPPEELERIFVPFHRLLMHRDRPGSGLGLYFAKKLVDQQGGRI